MTFKVENKAMGTILSVGRYLIMFCIYVGFSCVIYSIFTIGRYVIKTFKVENKAMGDDSGDRDDGAAAGIAK